MTRCAVLSAPILLPLTLCSIAGAAGPGVGGGWHFNTLVETTSRILADRGSGYLDLGALTSASALSDGMSSP